MFSLLSFFFFYFVDPFLSPPSPHQIQEKIEDKKQKFKERKETESKFEKQCKVLEEERDSISGQLEDKKKVQIEAEQRQRLLKNSEEECLRFSKTLSEKYEGEISFSSFSSFPLLFPFSLFSLFSLFSPLKLYNRLERRNAAFDGGIPIANGGDPTAG